MEPDFEPYAKDLALMVEASRMAADIGMSHFRQDPEVWYKNEGRSPVSEADIAIDELLKKVLIGARPDYGWLSEEAEDTAHRLAYDRVFIVDPIDGTRAYVGGRPDWCVSVGLVENGKPVAAAFSSHPQGASSGRRIWAAVLSSTMSSLRHANPIWKKRHCALRFRTWSPGPCILAQWPVSKRLPEARRWRSGSRRWPTASWTVCMFVLKPASGIWPLLMCCLLKPAIFSSMGQAGACCTINPIRHVACCSQRLTSR